ncbi:MAG: hypothetical protein EXR77_16990, partial [Myxococcales bacterium]|nr:hypothetical protein [Myxococcales bacterium]
MTPTAKAQQPLTADAGRAAWTSARVTASTHGGVDEVGEAWRRWLLAWAQLCDDDIAAAFDTWQQLTIDNDLPELTPWLSVQIQAEVDDAVAMLADLADSDLAEPPECATDPWATEGAIATAKSLLRGRDRIGCWQRIARWHGLNVNADVGPLDTALQGRLSNWHSLDGWRAARADAEDERYWWQVQTAEPMSEELADAATIAVVDWLRQRSDGGESAIRLSADEARVLLAEPNS